jgi:hypothetical protein
MWIFTYINRRILETPGTNLLPVNGEMCNGVTQHNNAKYCGNLSSQEIIHYYQRDRRSFSIIISSILKGQPCFQFIFTYTNRRILETPGTNLLPVNGEMCNGVI